MYMYIYSNLPCPTLELHSADAKVFSKCVYISSLDLIKKEIIILYTCTFNSMCM